MSDRWPGIPSDGVYGGNSWTPGRKAAPGRCLAEVWPAHQWHSAQCTRQAVDGGLCRQHAKQRDAWLSREKP